MLKILFVYLLESLSQVTFHFSLNFGFLLLRQNFQTEPKDRKMACIILTTLNIQFTYVASLYRYGGSWLEIVL